MGLSVVVVAAGGLPVIVSTNGYGLPCTISTNGYGVPVTQSTNGSGLAVIGVSFSPTIQLSATSVLESVAVNTAVGTLSVSPGTTGSPVFALVDSAGGKFNISGTSLRTNALLDYETATSHTIIVSVTGVTPTVTNSTFIITVTNVVAATPAAPVLTLTSGTSDLTPDFTLTGDLALNDTVRFQYSTAADFTGASELTNAIDAGEDAANSISFSTGTLAANTWYFRARIERPEAVASDWSNTATITLTGVALDASTTAWVNAVIADGGTVSTTQRTNVDALVVGLKADGLWTKLDRLWLFAGESEAHQAKIDVRSLASHTIGGTPAAFDAGGYKGDGSTFYINSGFNPTASGVAFVVSSASAGFYEQTRIIENKHRWGSFYGMQNRIINHPNLTTQDVALNGGVASITDGSPSPGFWVVTVPSSTTLNLYRNNSATPLGGTQAITESGTEVTAFGLFSRATGPSTFDDRTTAQLSAFFFGGALTGAQAVSLSNRINDYMIAWNRNQYNQNITTRTWDNAAKSGNMVLGADLLVGINSGGASTSYVRATGSASTGKKICEFTVTSAIAAGTSSVGLCNSTFSFAAAYLGINTNSVAYRIGGVVAINDATVATLSSYNVGDIITMEVDLDARTLKFAKNGGALSSAISIAAVTGALFPVMQLAADTESIYANFGAAYWTRAATSGYGNW